MFHVIKQLEERNVANDIEILLWSDRMDLIALSNNKGEVSLHRLSWARAWNLEPPNDGIYVQGMAWRPDGKVLAIAYSSGEILLVNVENKGILYKTKIEKNVSSVCWVREKMELKATSLGSDEVEQVAYMKYIDYSTKYLTTLPSFSNLDPPHSNVLEDTKNSNMLCEQKELNLLIIGTDDGFLHISIFGQFACAILNLNNYLGCSCSVINAHLSQDLGLLYVTVKDEFDEIKIATINSELFKTHKKELFSIAIKHGHLNNLISYLSHVLIPIQETWETILLEMDAKLLKYASKVPEGSLSADFLDLLTFGRTSEEMESFLLSDLTEKGLKKFGQVIDVCYSNIQKLLLNHVTKASQNITFHLAELRGMARLVHRYKAVGLSQDVITKAIQSNGAFLIKGGEMHQIINRFMISYKAFFRWLYKMILLIMDTPMTSEPPKSTQQDVTLIMEFVLNFDSIGRKSDDETQKGQFTMERLGQYLQDAPLTNLLESDNNLWETFLAKQECIRDHPSIIQRYKNYSLIQQFKHLGIAVENIFTVPRSLISEHFSLKNTLKCLKSDNKAINITSINVDNTTLVAFLNKAPPCSGIYFVEFTEMGVKCAFFYFHQESVEPYQILDTKFYSTNALSLLLQDCNNKNGILYQCSVGPIREKLIKIDENVPIDEQNVPRLNTFDLGGAMLKHIEGMMCSKFAVSGCRRVSIVLSESKKKVRLFEMEAEEDDEEDADMTNSSTRESDTSMQEDSSCMV